jgi:hypothetical protein
MTEIIKLILFLFSIKIERQIIDNKIVYLTMILII